MIHKIEKLFKRNELGARTRGQSKVPAVLECRAIGWIMFNSIVGLCYLKYVAMHCIIRFILSDLNELLYCITF